MTHTSLEFQRVSTCVERKIENKPVRSLPGKCACRLLPERCFTLADNNGHVGGRAEGKLKERE